MQQNVYFCLRETDANFLQRSSYAIFKLKQLNSLPHKRLGMSGWRDSPSTKWHVSIIGFQ